MAATTQTLIRRSLAIQRLGSLSSSSISIQRRCTRSVAYHPAWIDVVASGIGSTSALSYPTPCHNHDFSVSRDKGAGKCAASTVNNRYVITEGNADDKGACENDTVGGDNSNRSAYFPWRHESQPTERLLERNDFSGMPNNFRARLVRRIVSCRELNISMIEAIPVPFFTHSWESELVANFKQAFMLAFSELISSIFQTPVKNEQGIISLDSDGRSIINEAQVLLEDDAYLNKMMDKNLLAMYQAVCADKLRLKLSIRPVEAALEHIFTVSVQILSLFSYIYATMLMPIPSYILRPLLSREIVEKKPHLKGGFQKIENAFSHQGASFSEVKGMTIDLANEIGEEDASTRTVIADVAIKCTEFFQVKDALTGTIIQGMEDEREGDEVIHVVRFEVVTEKEDGGRKIGSWKIIDFDDMLNGNVFH
jgi:hypothetical protein